MKPVIVVGGGPAGIAAACTLAEWERKTLLLERSSRLGGRAASFYYHRMEEEIDYGQHVLMRCCSASIGLLRQLGMERAVSFQERLAVPIACGLKRSLLSSVCLPGPLHLLPSLLRYQPLSYRERINVLRAGLSLLTHTPRKAQTFADWLRRHGQGKNVITRLWDPICVATLNAHVHGVSTRAARMLFKEGFLSPHGADMGFFTIPLSCLFSAATPYLKERGSEVHSNSRVRQLLIENGRVCGVELSTGEAVEAEWVIAAVPPSDLLSLLPEALAGEAFFTRLRKIRFSPILNLHLWFDHPVMEEPFLIAIDSPVQAIFDITQIQGSEGPTHIVLSQSAAQDLIDLPVEVTKESLFSALAALLPEVRTAVLRDSLVIKSTHATLLPTLGSESLRPGVKTPIEKLLLAGDYTATGWPSTIEGAVRSGKIAAECVLH